ncbi:MAG TPA: HDOD domain-containing protein [Burkholderiales bacterium]|nr:HDOD domain-containing protein [Burkholderiales bacterium]
MTGAATVPNRQRVLELIATEIGRGELTFPTSSQLALRIRQALDDPDCAAASVARLIQADPLLAARVVGLANSVLYNRSGRVVTEIQGAVSRVGFSVVRSLATAIVARQIAGTPLQAIHRKMAMDLWEHTTHVAALAFVLARRATRQDPDAAMFAGLMHEVGGFYLLSRADEFPGLLDGSLMSDWIDDGEDEGDAGPKRSFESRVGRAILDALHVPATVVDAVETVWQGYLTLPPETLGDTVLLANRLVAVKSPFDRSGDDRPSAASLDMVVEDEMLTDILREATLEVDGLARVLRG